MKRRVQWSKLGIRWALVCVLVAAVSGGCRQQQTQALFTRPQLDSYQRLAILGLDAEQEQIFMACYLKSFALRENVVFVERGRLREILREQDLLKIEDRLDDKTRARIKQLLGVQALILCNYDSVGEGVNRYKLRVRIVDTETGAIVGSVITQAGNNFVFHCHTAVKALRADIQGETYYSYPETYRTVP